MRICLGRRLKGRAPLRHHNNFDFDFDGGVDGGGVPPALPVGRLTGPPPRLASKMTMMATSAGGPAM